MKQWYMLAATHFSIYLTAVLGTRACFPAHEQMVNCSTSQTLEAYIREVLYADNSALVASNLDNMQLFEDDFFLAADMFGQKINISETELLYQPPPRITNTPEMKLRIMSQ